jgi:hypothetical protein
MAEKPADCHRDLFKIRDKSGTIFSATTNKIFQVGKIVFPGCFGQFFGRKHGGGQENFHGSS